MPLAHCGSNVASLPRDALSALTSRRLCDENCCPDCATEVFGPIVTSSAPIAAMRNLTCTLTTT
jgi:hypothetical protein